MKRLMFISLTLLAVLLITATSVFAAANRPTAIAISAQGGTVGNGVYTITFTCPNTNSSETGTLTFTNPSGITGLLSNGTNATVTGSATGATVTIAANVITATLTFTVTGAGTGTFVNGITQTYTTPSASSNTGNFSYDASLPVEMTSFTAAAIPNGAELHWSTATEVNSASFEVERRAIGNQQSAISNWMNVGSVQASGTSSSPKDYVYVDQSVTPGKYAYRLKQIDNDGTFSYFGGAEVSVGSVARDFVLNANYPNPFNPSTQISFTVPENGRAVLRVFNVIGQEVATLFDRVVEAGFEQRATFNAANMPSGLYFARLEFGNQSTMKRMMLVK